MQTILYTRNPGNKVVDQYGLELYITCYISCSHQQEFGPVMLVSNLLTREQTSALVALRTVLGLLISASSLVLRHGIIHF